MLPKLALTLNIHFHACSRGFCSYRLESSGAHTCKENTTQLRKMQSFRVDRKARFYQRHQRGRGLESCAWLGRQRGELRVFFFLNTIHFGHRGWNWLPVLTKLWVQACERERALQLLSIQSSLPYFLLEYACDYTSLTSTLLSLALFPTSASIGQT